jgi:hypothetical protein
VSNEPRRALRNAILRQDLASFIRKTVTTLSPGAPFLDNWHIHAIAWHLEQVRRGAIRRLIINMPPRSLKSISASVAFPAFVLGHEPTRHVICVSYAQDLAANLMNSFRVLVETPWCSPRRSARARTSGTPTLSCPDLTTSAPAQSSS